MYNFLVKRGIPSDNIILDYAGLSTRDSISRAKLIFNVPDLLLISQEFQIQR
jgi:SanA protein